LKIDIVNIAKKHIMNFPGKKLGKKYIVFESDDWGSERIPSKESLKYLTSSGINVFSNPFNHLDSLETGDDLSALFEILLSYTDRHGNHPVFTANSVTANPDFEKIKISDFKEYHYQSTLQTYSNKDGCENSYTFIKDGMAAGIYHPQFHGREHLNVRQWLTALQSGNQKLLNAFSAGIYGIDLDTEFTNRANFMAAFDSNSEQETAEHIDIIEEGAALFKDLFGYSSDSFIAPCYTWHPSLEILLKENGIKYIQGLPIQYVPIYGGKYKKLYHYQGEPNNMQQFYFIRNCFFEPALNSKFNWIKDCLRRLEIIFFWGKPAIIGTHRINFMGSLNEENRRQNLRIFSVLLKSILETWPDAEFTTTDKLGELY
jgi:hypothetical protein